MIFVEQPVVSLSLYNRANHWLLEPGWDGQQHLTTPIWKCTSGIGNHRFTFLMDLLLIYTFYTNLTIFSIKRLLIEDVTSLIVFNLWKVEKSMQHRLMPTAPGFPRRTSCTNSPEYIHNEMLIRDNCSCLTLSNNVINSSLNILWLIYMNTYFWSNLTIEVLSINTVAETGYKTPTHL